MLWVNYGTYKALSNQQKALRQEYLLGLALQGKITAMKPSWPLTRQKTLQSHRTHVWPMALSCLSEMRGGKAVWISHTYSKTHFQSIQRVPDRSAVRFMVMVGWLLSDGGVWTHIDAKSQIHRQGHHQHDTDSRQNTHIISVLRTLYANFQYA